MTTKGQQTLGLGPKELYNKVKFLASLTTKYYQGNKNLIASFSAQRPSKTAEDRRRPSKTMYASIVPAVLIIGFINVFGISLPSNIARSTIPTVLYQLEDGTRGLKNRKSGISKSLEILQKVCDLQTFNNSYRNYIFINGTKLKVNSVLSQSKLISINSSRESHRKPL